MMIIEAVFNAKNKFYSICKLQNAIKFSYKAYSNVGVSLNHTSLVTGYCIAKRPSSNLEFYHKKLFHLMTINTWNKCKLKDIKKIGKNGFSECKHDEYLTANTELQSIKDSNINGIKDSNRLKYPKKNVLAAPSDSEEIDFIAPQLKPTFNIAAYADKSDTLKHFIHLGVEIAKWEMHKDICLKILQMNFEEDIKPYIFFLHDLGIPLDETGRWLTVNPFVFEETLENIQVRINYLESKKFEKEAIIGIIRRVPKWVNYSTTKIDKELGVLQRQFHLTNKEVRDVATRDPKLILYIINKKFFLQKLRGTISDLMGFSINDQKKLLLSAPRIYRTNHRSLMRRFNVIHNDMGLSHETIIKFPQLFGLREIKLSERHEFLKFIGKNQYNPLKPNYISPIEFIKGTDAEFCTNVASCSIEIFNDFLKTL